MSSAAGIGRLPLTTGIAKVPMPGIRNWSFVGIAHGVLVQIERGEVKERRISETPEVKRKHKDDEEAK